MKALGQHLLVELYGCSSRALDAIDEIREAMVQAARLVNATILDVVQRQFEPHGVTVVVIIAESHLSIHTWPEHGYAAVDVFTCGDDPEFGEVTRLLGQRLGATSVSTIEVKRGLLAQLEPSAISHPLSAVGLRRSGG